MTGPVINSINTDLRNSEPDHQIPSVVSYDEHGLLKIILTRIFTEKNPSFIYLEISESAASGTVLYVISPSPPSDYFIKGDNPKSLFGINKTSVVLLGKLDYEKQQYHIMYLSLKDNVKESVTLYINVLNEYDEVPEIILVNDVYGIPEELAAGTDVGKVFDVKDADPGDAFTYALSGQDAQFFHIDGTSGRMTVTTRLDSDGPSAVIFLHHLFVNVTDRGNNSVQRSMVIEILNINDNPPRFQTEFYNLLVHPTQTESAIAQLVVNDIDRHGDDRFLANLAIIDGNEFELFSLKNNYLHADIEQLFEMAHTGVFSLVVEARDPSSEGPELVSTAVVVVVGYSMVDLPSDESNGKNKHAPVWIYPAFGKRKKVVPVWESAKPGEVVLSVQANDEDEGEAGMLLYTFTPTSAAKRPPRSGRQKAPVKPNAAGMFFRMDPEKGNLSVAMPLDRDKKTGGVKSFSIAVTATDSGNPPRSITSHVKLLLKNTNDNAPSFSQRLYKTSYGCDVDLTKPIYIFEVTDDDNDNIKTVAIVDAESKMRYSLFKKGRPYALKAKQLPDPHVDKVDVITVAASDGDRISTATILVRVQSCSSTEKLQPQKQLTSTEVSKNQLSASASGGSQPETTATPPTVASPTSSSIPRVVTSRSVTQGGDEVVTICSTAKVTTNSALPAHTVTPLPLTLPSTSPSSTSAQSRNRCPGRLIYGRDSDSRPCCQCSGNTSLPGRRNVLRKTDDHRKYTKKLHNNGTNSKTKANSTRDAVTDTRCRCSNGTSDSSNSYSSGTISAIAATSVAVPCILATGVIVKKLALRGRLSVRDTPPEVSDSTTDRQDASSR